MNIRVRLYGTLRRLSNPETPGLWCGQISEGTSIRELIIQLGTMPAEVAIGCINGVAMPLDSLIPDDAEIILVTPFGGG